MRYDKTSRMQRTMISVFTTCLLLIMLFSNLQGVIRTCANTRQNCQHRQEPVRPGPASQSVLYNSSRAFVEIVGRGDTFSARTQSRLTSASSRNALSYHTVRILLTAFMSICMILLSLTGILEISRRTFACTQKFIITYIHNTDGKKG